MNKNCATYKRQSALIEMNIRWLRQMLRLLPELADDAYTTPPPKLAPLRANSHLRHVLEFYECFFDGLEWSHIDYDARRRDESVETSRLVAMERINGLIEQFESTQALQSDCLVFVKAEDADSMHLPDPYLISSIGRELSVLSSHTVHHFALIAIALRAHGIEPGSEFGVAPSTLRFRESSRREAA
jgi:hypothetical protein